MPRVSSETEMRFNMTRLFCHPRDSESTGRRTDIASRPTNGRSPPIGRR
jgi:hypothetical protein